MTSTVRRLMVLLTASLTITAATLLGADSASAAAVSEPFCIFLEP